MVFFEIIVTLPVNLTTHHQRLLIIKKLLYGAMLVVNEEDVFRFRWSSLVGLSFN